MDKHKEDLKFGLNAENIIEEELKKYFKGVRKKKVKNDPLIMILIMEL